MERAGGLSPAAFFDMIQCRRPLLAVITDADSLLKRGGLLRFKFPSRPAFSPHPQILNSLYLLHVCTAENFVMPTFVLADPNCKCGCTLVACCPGVGVKKTLFATITFTPTGICAGCTSPISVTLTWYAAGTGPMGLIPPFTTTDYWYGCKPPCGGRADVSIVIVLYCVTGSPNKWFMQTTCWNSNPCDTTPTSGPQDISAYVNSCDPFSISGIPDAGCCGAGAGTTITISP